MSRRTEWGLIPIAGLVVALAGCTSGPITPPPVPPPTGHPSPAPSTTAVTDEQLAVSQRLLPRDGAIWRSSDKVLAAAVNSGGSSGGAARYSLQVACVSSSSASATVTAGDAHTRLDCPPSGARGTLRIDARQAAGQLGVQVTAPAAVTWQLVPL